MKGSDPATAAKPTIVLEHGAWADGSSWGGVVTRLQQDGYTVDVPPNPLRGVSSDSAYLASYLATVPGPVVLAGHSYGGFVTTNAATGDKNIKALVYVDAYIPAQGDTINSLTAQFPGSQITPAALNFVPSPGGVTDAYIKPALFRSILANDLPASQAAELAATQRPIAASALTEVSGPPAGATSLGQHPQLGRDRNGRPCDPARGTGIHGRPRARHGNQDQRLAPVTDLPARHRRERHRRSRARHLIGHQQVNARTPDDELYAKSTRRSRRVLPRRRLRRQAALLP